MARRREDDDIRVHGWAKFFYNVFLLVTFPFRKPVKFVLVALFLFGLFYIPVLTHQVEKDDLFDWYKYKTEPFITAIKDGITEFKKEYLPQDEPVKASKRRQRTAGNKQKSSAVENYTKKYDKNSAKKRKNEYIGDEVDKQYQLRMEEYKNSAIRSTGRKNPYYGSASRFGLSYPDEILEVSGEADIVNANELIVGSVHMFLFGIYTDPNSGNYEYAAKYLIEETSGKVVRCEIVAYSAQGVATADCFIGVKSINESLVSMGMAKKVW